MTPDERSLLEETLALAKDNNKILRSIRSSNRIAMVMRVLYWVVIVALSFGAYYFIQPYFTLLTRMGGSPATGGGLQGTLDQAQQAANSLRDLLK